jgi:prepilin-type N-terminal cleavage/methylation domain-containing protein
MLGSGEAGEQRMSFTCRLGKAADQGYTLVELLVALVLLGIVSTGIYRTLVTHQQTSLAQTQRIDLQQNLRAAVTILPAEIRELDATDGDIHDMTATSLTIRAMRQLGVICQEPVLGGGLGGIAMTIRQDPFMALRDFNLATDSLLIFYEGDEGTRSDDSWVPAKMTGISSQNCPDGSPGRQITMNPSFIAGQLNVAGAIPAGAPVRGFEVVTYGVYQAADGGWYLGQTRGGTTQPLIGPLTGSNGVTFTYYDGNGAVTAVPTQVASIEIRLRGQTVSRVRDATSSGVAYRTDSVVTRVAVRNNVRFAGN